MPYKAVIAIVLFAWCASASAQEQTGKIVFYRESHFRNSDYKPPVFCDGVELARVVNGSYLEVAAPPGRHICVAESVQGPATTIDIVPGNAAYLRVDITPTIKRHASLITTTEAELLPGESAQGSYMFDVKNGVQPLVLILNLDGGTVRCKTSVDAADASVPNEIHLDVHDLPGLSANDPRSDGAFGVVLGGISYPSCLYCPDPQYTEKARHAKLEGTLQLRVVIGSDGKATDIEIVKGIGQGLDEEAVNAVRTWRFRPAVGPNGDPVAIVAPIEITFRFLK